MTDTRAFESLLPQVDHELSVALERTIYIAGFDLDRIEVARRDAAGLGAVTSAAALHALAWLQERRRVSLLGVRPEHRAALGRLSAGAVEIDEENDEVVRLARMPLHMRYLVAVRSSTRSALDAVGSLWWAPIQIGVGADHAPLGQIQRARRSGTGLVDRNTVQAVAIEQRLGRMTPLLWRQSELVYDAWVRSRVEPIAEAAGQP